MWLLLGKECNARFGLGELEREAEELRRKFGDREGELEEKIAEISARLEAVQEELEMRGTALVRFSAVCEIR